MTRPRLECQPVLQLGQKKNNRLRARAAHTEPKAPECAFRPSPVLSHSTSRICVHHSSRPWGRSSRAKYLNLKSKMSESYYASTHLEDDIRHQRHFSTRLRSRPATPGQYCTKQRKRTWTAQNPKIICAPIQRSFLPVHQPADGPFSDDTNHDYHFHHYTIYLRVGLLVRWVKQLTTIVRLKSKHMQETCHYNKSINFSELPSTNIASRSYFPRRPPYWFPVVPYATIVCVRKTRKSALENLPNNGFLLLFSPISENHIKK